VWLLCGWVRMRATFFSSMVYHGLIPNPLLTHALTPFLTPVCVSPCSRVHMRDTTFSSEAYGTHEYKDLTIEGRLHLPPYSPPLHHDAPPTTHTWPAGHAQTTQQAQVQG
jgi:hypothetical protein